MNTSNIPIDFNDIPEITDCSKAKKNPFAEKIIKYGYSTTVHYSPEYIANKVRSNVEMIEDMDMLDLDPDERRAYQKYLEANKKFITE